MSLTEVDPNEVFFTFSRLRPQFSCGRRVEDTLNAILNNELRAEDLPPISVLLDPATGHMFSLNNRRLYVFKSLQAEGKLQTIPVRVKPVPQTKRMKDKYTAEKCAKIAKLMPERVAAELLGSDDEAEGLNYDSDERGKEKKSHDAEPPEQDRPGQAALNTPSANALVMGESDAGVARAVTSPPKPAKPVRNMDDWTDEEDIKKGKKGKRTTKANKKQ